MPLYADHPPSWVSALDALDHAVVRLRTDTERCAEPIDGLVVNGVHGERLRADNSSEPGRRVDAHAVHTGATFLAQFVRRNRFALGWEVLHERSAEAYINHLDSATDREGRKLALSGRRQQRELRDVSRTVHGPELRMRCLAVVRGVHIFAAGQHEARHRIEHVDRRTRLGERRYDEGDQSGRLERANIRRVESDSLDAIDNPNGRGDSHERRGGVRVSRSTLVHSTASGDVTGERESSMANGSLARGLRAVAAAAFQSIS